MAQNFLSDLKITLDGCIAELDEIHFMFCQNPKTDFTRNRKLSFHDYIHLMIQMQSKSVSNEILDFFAHSLSSPTKSAFTQQRFKLQPEGWNFLFHIFVTQCRGLSDQLYQTFAFWHAMVLTSTSHEIWMMKELLLMKVKKAIMQFTSTHFMTSPILCSRSKRRKLTLCRNLLGSQKYLSKLRDKEMTEVLKQLYGINVCVCKSCGGHLGKPQLRIPQRC